MPAFAVEQSAVPVRKMILYGFSTRTSSFAAKSALMLTICPPAVSPSDAMTGIDSTRSDASIGASFDARDASDEAERVAIDELGFEYAGDDRCRARVHGLQRLDEREILLLEHAAHDRERFGPT